MIAALLKKPGKFEITDIPYPGATPEEAIVEVKACGICGSDLRYFYGDNPWARQTLGIRKPNPPDMILGHELAGEVVDTGCRVVPIPFKACEECNYCRRGLHHLCGKMKHLGHSAGWQGVKYNPGGYAQFCAIWKDKLYPLSHSISYEEATFLDGLAVAVHAVRKAGIEPGDEVGILGSGPIGLSIMQVAKTFGAKRTFVTDVYPKPLAIAQELGADTLINVSEEDAVKRVMEETGNIGLKAVFNTVGTRETVIQSLKMLRRGGCAVLMAGLSTKLVLDFDLLAGEHSLITSANYLYPDFQTAIDLMESKRVKVRPMITHRFPLREIKKAFQIMEDKKKYAAVKVILFP